MSDLDQGPAHFWSNEGFLAFKFGEQGDLLTNVISLLKGEKILKALGTYSPWTIAPTIQRKRGGEQSYGCMMKWVADSVRSIQQHLPRV